MFLTNLLKSNFPKTENPLKSLNLIFKILVVVFLNVIFTNFNKNHSNNFNNNTTLWVS